MSSETQIRTSIDDNGVPKVLMQIEETKFAITPDAAMDIGLHLIHAAASARAEEALFHIGNEKSLSVPDLIKWMRGPHA